MHRNATLLNSSALERLRSLSASLLLFLPSYHLCPRFIPPLYRARSFSHSIPFSYAVSSGLSFSPTPTWFNICTQIDNGGEKREYAGGSGGVDNTFLRRHIRLRRWQNAERGKGEGGTTSWDESMVTGRWGSLIGLHNIDSITGEFFAALRASSTLSQRSVARKAEKRRIKGGRIRGTRG